MKILVLNGPNLDKLGSREPDLYGTTTLEELEEMCRAEASKLGAEIDFRQTNDENEMIGWVTQPPPQTKAIIINPAAFTHYSLKLAEALREGGLDVIEVHITNIHSREPWRSHSVISKVARGSIIGLGVRGYVLAIQAIAGKGE